MKPRRRPIAGWVAALMIGVVVVVVVLVYYFAMFRPFRPGKVEAVTVPGGIAPVPKGQEELVKKMQKEAAEYRRTHPLPPQVPPGLRRMFETPAPEGQ